MEEIGEYSMAATDLTVYDAARIVNCHHNTIRKLIRLGRLPAYRVGSEWRIKRDSLDKMREGDGGYA